MAVLEPLKVVIENYPKVRLNTVKSTTIPKEEMGKRKVIFSRTIYIERSDFMENPLRKILPSIAGQKRFG